MNEPIKIVGRGGRHYTYCDTKNHYDVVLDKNGTPTGKKHKVFWTCENCKKSNLTKPLTK